MILTRVNKRGILFVAALGFCALAVGVGLDFSRFARACRAYAMKAQNPTSETIRTIPREAVVVLTGDHSRIPKAIELLRVRESEFLLISGAGASLKDLVNHQGDPSTHIHEVWEKIRLESTSTSTIENARNSIPILRRAKIHRIVLVTSDYHMLRALQIFQQVGNDFEYISYPVVSEFTELFSSNFDKWPGGTWKIFLEYLKFNLYRTYYAPRLAKIEN